MSGRALGVAGGLALLGLALLLASPEPAPSSPAGPAVAERPLRASGPTLPPAPGARPADAAAAERRGATATGDAPADPVRAELDPTAPTEPVPLPATPQTLYLTLELGHDAARPALLLRRPIPYRPLAPAGPFVLEVEDATGALRHLRFAAPGLVPEDTPPALLEDDGSLLVGDELYLARVPLILKLPDLPLPLACRVLDPAGTPLGRFELSAPGPQTPAAAPSERQGG